MSKQFIFIAACVISMKLSGQPTLNSSGITPAVGETYAMKLFTATANQQGPSGANQTWNFSTLTASNTYHGSIANPASTPFSSTYPSATVCNTIATISNYEYFTITSSEMNRIGTARTFGPVTVVLSNPTKLLQFPLTYNNTFSDSYNGSITGPGYSGTRTGNLSATADAYGTLITPAGTYSNVLRIKVQETTTDNLGSFGTTTTTRTDYFFYKNGIHWPIMSFSEAVTGTTTTRTGSWTESTVGINEINSSISNLTLFPNPVSISGTLTFELKESGDVSLAIYDAFGRMVKEIENTFLPSGSHTRQIDLSGLASGLYGIRISSENGDAFARMAKAFN